MTTATKDINEAAVDHIAGACRERINEMIDDLLRYVEASESTGKITLTISVTPDPKIEGTYSVAVVPKMAVQGISSEGAATIKRIGQGRQLVIAGL